MLVIESGFLTTIQDLGRSGRERFGVPPAGAMDAFALRAANALVGNPPEAAGLECALGGCSLLAEEDALVAAAGVGYSLAVGGRAIPLWMAAFARPGERIELAAGPRAGWGYLALAGGIATPPVLGSRATYLRGGFGGLEGRALRPGDGLPLGAVPPYARLMALAGRRLPAARLSNYAPDAPVPAVPGPQAEAFSEESLADFFSAEYAITSASDRMGYRLAGPALHHRAGADLLSEGTATGSVQVPGDGQPVALLAERQATGGYPKIATITRAGLPLLAQRRPGEGRVRFAAVSATEAQAAWRALIAGLEEIK